MSNPLHPGLPVRLFASDVEDTLIADNGAADKFKAAWESFETARRPLLVYNSGRSISEIEWMVLHRRLPAAEFLIGGIGTEIHDPIDASVREAFRLHIAPGWDREVVHRIVEAIPGVRLQAPELLSDYKLSWHWPRAMRSEVARLELRLQEAGIDVTVLYSSNVFLDVIPRRAGKGNALAWLCHRIGVQLEQVVVAGAGANNLSMFALPGVRGILVGNVSSELLSATSAYRPFLTMEKTADGVLRGLRNFGAPGAASAETEQARVVSGQATVAGGAT